uniref:protein-tyrosine-phosphatase n=1 Tax=Neospora caninum (strain Liverpool) TaxID=572307 RepID=A0A0F7UIN6_NEOCL|nr:TPA: dual specificity phosphatase, catalytic domain-containing protein [Neospora caninum Liverpool]
MSRSSAGFVPAGGPSGGPAFSFFAHFSPLSGQQKQAAHQILPHLFLGSAAAARSATWLHQNRITHIVCVHNAEASPQELKRQLTSPTAANDAKHAKSRQQRPQTVAEQLVVHADRCVYCCCYVQDTPQQVFLPMLSPVIDFVDNAIRDQSFRGGGGSPSQVPSQASQPGSAQPRKHPTRNHLFVCGEQQTSLVDDEKEGIPAKSFGGVSGPARSGVNQGNSRAPQHGNVLVHCAKGISRSASFVICYLMFRRCWSYNDSFTYIRRKRPIYPNVGFQIQLQEIEKRLQQFRPTIPRVDASEDPAAPKRITATAVAAGLVGPDEDEPDLFRRDPTAAEKLLEILREARTALNAASLEQKLIASILTQLLETQELVENMFSQSSLLRDRQKWELHGLFFENLKSYGVAAPPDVLATAEKVAKRASDLKLVFTATLPGVAMADTVAEEIRRWVQVATKVAEEREKAQAADRPKKANASGEHASATRVRSSGGDTAAAETSPAPRDKPQDDSKSADGATNGGRSLSPRNTQRNGGPGKPAQRDVSDGLAFSSGKDLFGRQGASTADTLRERLKKIREKRAALVDTSKAPATDQASSPGTPSDARNSARSCGSPAAADGSRSQSPRVAARPAVDDWEDRGQKKKLKKQKKREKKEKKRMKKQKSERSERSRRVSERSVSSGSLSRSSWSPPQRRRSPYGSPVSTSGFASRKADHASGRRDDSEERGRYSSHGSNGGRAHRVYERSQCVESRGGRTRNGRHSSDSEERRRDRRDRSRSLSHGRWKRRRSSSRSVSPRRRRDETRGTDTRQESLASRRGSRGSPCRSETKGRTGSPCDHGPASRWRPAPRYSEDSDVTARRRRTRRSVDSQRSSRSRSHSPGACRPSRERGRSRLSHSQSRSPRDPSGRRR